MKTRRIFVSIVIVFCACIATAQNPLTVNVPTAGGFRIAFIAAGGNKATVTNLTVTGNIDARDVKFMRDSMPVLAVIDIGAVQTKAYNGADGTSTSTGTTSYPANTMPESSFQDYSLSPVDGIQGNLTLKTVLLPVSLKVIGRCAFCFCRGLTALKIPNSVTTIEDEAYLGCTGFTGQLIIPNSVTSIKYCAFQRCSGFTGNLILPSSISNLEMGVFDGCTGFTGKLIIPKSITKIDMITFQSCEGLTSVVFPNNLKTIEYDAFGWCSGLTGDIIIPGSVNTIIDGAFRNCPGIENFYIPSSVTLINDFSRDPNGDFGIFSGDSSLRKIVVNKTSPLRSDTATFDGVNKTTCELVVPKGSKAAYQAATGWKLFTNITEAIFVTLNTQGGQPTAPITTTLTNSTITEPAVPVRDGYSFVGWYKEAACTNAWDFATDIVTAPVTLYAKWTQVLVSIVDHQFPGIRLYPNPATTTLNLGNLQQNAQISIFSMDGKLMKQQNITTSESTIDIEDFPKGVYLLKVNFKEISIQQKFIKQ